MNEMNTSEDSDLTCMYCMLAKPSSLFNREHVIHRSMTKGINDNLVLVRRVCKDCNSSFGNRMDLKLSRGYWEVLNRFRSEMKPISEAHHLDKRSIEFSLEDPSAFKEDIGEITDVLQDSLILDMLDSTKKRFTHSQLKKTSLDKLVDIDQVQYFRVFTQFQEGANEIGELVKPFFASKFTITENLEKHSVKATATYDELPQRALCKIAFNYLGEVTKNEPSIVLQDSFNVIRKFIYLGHFPYIRPVERLSSISTYQRNGARLNGHWITIGTNQERATVVVKLSLFNQSIWKIILSPSYIDTAEIPSVSHVWDFKKRLCEQVKADQDMLL